MSESEGLTPGEPLPSGEVWLRELTNTDYLKSDGSVHYQALKGRAISPPAAGVAWSHELSGRARSLAGDIAAHGNASAERARQRFVEHGQAVPSKIKFVGVAFARADQLRDGTAPVATDTIFTPNEDPAHADFVCYGCQDDQLDPVRDWLMKKLKTATAGSLDLVDAE